MQRLTEEILNMRLGCQRARRLRLRACFTSVIALRWIRLCRVWPSEAN